MTEVRRSRQRSTAEVKYPVVHPVDELSGFRPHEKVEIVLRITAEVVDGNMKSGDLENWIKDAIHRHHAFRAGSVGYGNHAGIKPPRCKRLDTDD